MNTIWKKYPTLLALIVSVHSNTEQVHNFCCCTSSISAVHNQFNIPVACNSYCLLDRSQLSNFAYRAPYQRWSLSIRPHNIYQLFPFHNHTLCHLYYICQTICISFHELSLYFRRLTQHSLCRVPTDDSLG